MFRKINKNLKKKKKTETTGASLAKFQQMDFHKSQKLSKYNTLIETYTLISVLGV